MGAPINPCPYNATGYAASSAIPRFERLPMEPAGPRCQPLFQNPPWHSPHNCGFITNDVLSSFFLDTMQGSTDPASNYIPTHLSSKSTEPMQEKSGHEMRNCRDPTPPPPKCLKNQKNKIKNDNHDPFNVKLYTRTIYHELQNPSGKPIEPRLKQPSSYLLCKKTQVEEIRYATPYTRPG